MKILRLLAAAAIIAPLLAAAHVATPAHADTAGIIAVANDQPITELDITQRIALLQVLEDMPQAGMSRQQALRDLIDDQVKIVEATRLGMLPTDSEISERIDRVAKNMKINRSQLLAKLKAQGISEASLRRYMTASTGFSRIIAAKYRQDVQASDAEVDAKMAEIKANAGAQMSKMAKDPRLQAVTVYTLLEINLPVDGDDQMLLQSRAIEAQQLARKFKGCDSVKAASEGIFDVKVGKKFEADGAKLPKPLKDALDKAGPGKAVGPMRGKGGIQLLALCEVKKITPPKPDFKMPTREQVQRIVINQKFDKLEEDYLKLARDKVYVEYRDPSYAQK